jgi:hypothetical protein
MMPRFREEINFNMEGQKEGGEKEGERKRGRERRSFYIVDLRDTPVAAGICSEDQRNSMALQ